MNRPTPALVVPQLYDGLDTIGNAPFDELDLKSWTHRDIESALLV
jgi:hypothetical protein